MEKIAVMSYQESSDASLIYHERSAADYARLNSSIVYGNIADVMRDAIIILEPTVVLGTRKKANPEKLEK